MLSQVGPKGRRPPRCSATCRPGRITRSGKLRADPLELGEIAVDAVVQIERVAAPQLDPGERRGAVGDQRPARLAVRGGSRARAAPPPPGSPGRSARTRARRRDRRRKAAADIEMIDRPGPAHDLGRDADGAGEGIGVDALRADMEGDAHLLRHRAGAPRSARAPPRAATPNLPVSVRRAPSPGTARRTNSSRSPAPPVAWTSFASSSLWSSTKRRTPCAVIGLGDRLRALHRMHEVADGLGQPRLDGPDLADRGGVEVPHAAGPERIEHRGRVVALDGIEHVAREGPDDSPCRRR